MERKSVQLKLLPVWLQYVIAITVTLFVVAMAWHIGKDRPTPQWIELWLVPILGWTGLLLLVTGVVATRFEKRKS